ncbi:MAG: 7TM-DISM domain-containing protein, partial [Ferruginibacter sp.]
MMQFKLFVPVVDSCVKKIYLFLQLLLICSAATSRGISFNDSIAIITDNRSPELVIQQLHLATIHFLKQSNNRVDIGLVGNDYHYFLLKLSVSDSLPQPLYLSIDNTSLDSLQIYTMTGNGTAKLLYEGGSTIAFNTSRNYVWHTAPLAIGPQPSYYLVAIKAAYKNLNVRYDIIEPDALQQQYAIYQRYVFFYMGIVSMIAFVMLIAVLLFKKAVFGAYLGYTICAGGWILTHYGCIFPLLYPN